MELERVTTTFWQDFSIADMFGTDAVEDTYKRAFQEWKSNVRYFSEFVLALNYKIWQWHERGDAGSAFAALYHRLWEEANDWAWGNYKGEDLNYYFRVTD